MAGTKLDNRQVVNRSALSMTGSAVNDTLDTIFPKIDAELAKLFEDRNITLVDGGVIAFPAAGTSVTFTTNLKLHINSQVAGGSPTVIDLAATTRTLSANLKMIYVVINRTAGTATVTDDASTLPAQTSANQEVVLIAKRVDSGDGTKRVYFRGGFSLSAGQSARFGTAGYMFASEFAIADATDTTKKIVMQASGSTTGKTLTLASAITLDRTLTFPDITDTLVSRTNTETLSNKQMQYSSANDSTTTGSNASLQAFTTGIVRLTNASLTSVSGIPAGSSGQILIIENKTGNQISINNEETTPTAANRIQTGSGSNVSMPNNACFIFVYDTTSQRWQLASGSGSGSGGSGGSKNYLSTVTTSQSTTPNTGNGNFEAGSTTGWSLSHTTIDSTTKLPNQASGSWTSASGNLAISAVTSGRLAGNYSGQIQQSSGASTAGDMMVSDAFYVDTEDQNKILRFSMYYQLTAGSANTNFSGTSSNSFGVAIYDVTNSVWIQPSGNFGFTQNSGSGICNGEFQTSSNGTQYRIAIYFPNASTGTFTMLVDDIIVGPQYIAQGAVVTDWESFTPTGTWTSNVTYTGRRRRVGDMEQVAVLISCTGAPTATTLAINLDRALDTSKIISLGGTEFAPVGFGSVLDAGVNNYPAVLVGMSSSGTQVYPYIMNASGTYGAGTPITNTAPMTFGSGDAVSIMFEYPVSGWSSNVQMSTDTDTRVVSAKAKATGSRTPTTSKAINYDTVIYDTHGALTVQSGDTAGWKFTAPVSGYYDVTGVIYTGTGSASATYYVYINGVQDQALGTGVTSATVYSVAATIKLNAGDYADIRSDATPTVGNASNLNQIAFTRRSGPSVIAASESVNCKYGDTSGHTYGIGTNQSAFTYNTKFYDTHNAYNTSTGEFTAPIAGKYHLYGLFRLTSVTANVVTVGRFFKNGTQFYETVKAMQDNVFNGPSFDFQTEVQLNAGDKVTFGGYYNDLSGVNKSWNSSTDSNYFIVTKVGN